MPKLFYVGVKGVLCMQDKCLLLYRKKEKGSHWDLPGGRMEAGEQSIETFLREVEEEIGPLPLTAKPELLVAYPLNRDLPDGHGLFFLYYLVRVESFEPRLSTEHSEFHWIDRAQLQKLSLEYPLLDGCQEALEAAFERLDA